MSIKNIMKSLIKKIKGNYRCAIDDGMIVEEGVSVMGGCEFGSEPYLITLKKFCRISFDVAFLTHDGGTWAFRNDNPDKKIVKYGPIVIGEYSFVGCRSIIMPGVTIGKNCVIGAGSVVTKDIPDGMVACGVPAKIMCSTNEYEKKCREIEPTDFDYSRYEKNKKNYLVDYYMKK